MLITEKRLRRLIRSVIAESNMQNFGVVGSKAPDLTPSEEENLFFKLADLCQEWGETSFDADEFNYEDERGQRYTAPGTKLSQKHMQIMKKARSIADQLLTRGPSYKHNDFEKLVEDLEHTLDSGTILSKSPVEAIFRDYEYPEIDLDSERQSASNMPSLDMRDIPSDVKDYRDEFYPEESFEDYDDPEKSDRDKGVKGLVSFYSK